MTHPLQPFRNSKHSHIHQSADSHFNEKTLLPQFHQLNCDRHFPLVAATTFFCVTTSSMRCARYFTFRFHHLFINVPHMNCWKALLLLCSKWDSQQLVTATFFRPRQLFYADHQKQTVTFGPWRPTNPISTVTTCQLAATNNR